MSEPWPGEWVSAAEKRYNDVEEKVDLPAGERTGPGFTNDHGVLHMVGNHAGQYLCMYDIPPNMENHA